MAVHKDCEPLMAIYSFSQAPFFSHHDLRAQSGLNKISATGPILWKQSLSKVLFRILSRRHSRSPTKHRQSRTNPKKIYCKRLCLNKELFFLYWITKVLWTMLIIEMQGTRTAYHFCTQPSSKAHHSRAPKCYTSPFGNQTPAG